MNLVIPVKLKMKKFFTLFFLLPFFLNAQQVAKYSKILPENELGLRKVELFNGRYGYINQKEKEVIPPVYISISDFNNGVIWAQSEIGNFMFWIPKIPSWCLVI